MHRWWVLVLLVGCREPQRMVPPDPPRAPSVDAPRADGASGPPATEESATEEPERPSSVPVSGFLGPAGPVAVTPASAATCARLETRATQRIEALREPCGRAEDCALLELRCPFGCYAVVSASADRSNAADAIADFASACPVKCGYKCAQPPESLECVDGACQLPDPRSG